MLFLFCYFWQMARQFHCQRCNLSFNRKWNWERHFDLVHRSPSLTFQCPFCPTKRKNKADMRQHLRMSHPERKAQVQADPGLIREVRLRENSTYHVSDVALHTPSPAVAVRSVIHIPDSRKSNETPASLSSPGFQLPVDLQNLLDNNCQDMLQTAAVAASISPTSEVVKDKTLPIKIITGPAQLPRANVMSNQDNAHPEDLPAAVPPRRLVLDTNINPNIPYVPERCATTTQTGISSVEAVPKSPKYLAPSRISQGGSHGDGKFRSCGTGMEETEGVRNKSSVGERPPPSRDETCPHGIKLPVYEKITSTSTEANSRKRTVSERIFCVKCWRHDSEEEEEEDSDWGF